VFSFSQSKKGRKTKPLDLIFTQYCLLQSTSATTMTSPFVAVAGATGGLGQLIAMALIKRGVAVKALVRPNTDPSRTEKLRRAGATIAPVDLSAVPALTNELTGAMCVVSSLQGLRDVIHTAQGNLLKAAVAAKVPKFIPSDFSLDFTKTKPGSNRNLDLRREFHAELKKSGIAWTSILNGGFLELLVGDSPMVNHKSRKVAYIGQESQLLDFTSMGDTAAYTAAVAADPKPTPNFLRIASATVSARDIANAESNVEGAQYKPGWMGPVWFIEIVIRVMRLFGGEKEVFPIWQGMQYMTNMASGAGKLKPLDNDRYPELVWTTMEEFLREHKNDLSKK
jgi:NAD(P)-dependent dehydrogenase (short-subunit alcohol dehydrogenase family)